MTKIAIVIVTIALLGTTAHGDPSETPERLYAEGQQAYDRADYATAIAKWQAAYDASHEGDLFFNIAQAKRRAGDCAGALAAYKSFIAADPAADQKPLAEDLIRELEGKCRAKPVAPPEPPQEVRTPDPVHGLNVVDALNAPKHPGHALKIAAITTGGASLLTIAIGIGLGVHAQSLANEVSTACRTSCDWTQWKAKDAAGRSDAAIGGVLDVGGAIGLASAGVLYYLGIRHPTITVTPMSREGATGVSWSGSW